MPRKKKVTVPEPRRLPSGNWFIQLRLGGRSISITEPDAATCHAKAVALKAGLIEQAAKPDRTTLRAAIDKFIESRSAILSPSTVRTYRIIQRNRFSELMDLPVSAITKSVFQRAVNREAQRLAPKTLRSSASFISSVIYQETGSRFTVSLPPLMPHERAFLTDEQVKVFCGAIRGSRFETACLLGLLSCRCSEIMGLRWQDVDLERGLAHIRWTRVPGEDNRLVGKPSTKTAASTRTIKLTSRLIELLRDADKSGEYVCSVDATSLREYVNEVCASHGLPHITLHGLRHTFASLGYHLGVPDKAMQEMGGWADAQTMRNIYTHISRADVAAGENKVLSFFDQNANEKC